MIFSVQPFFSSSSSSVCFFLRCRESRLRYVSCGQGERKPKRKQNQNGMPMPKPKGYVRGLSVPEEAFLLLEFLHLVLVVAGGNEVVDVEKVPLGGDVEAGVLLPDAAVTTRGEGPGRGVLSHALGAGARVHLLLVEGHPFRVGVRRQGLLGRCLGEDGARSHVALDGQSVEGHLMGLGHKWSRSGAKVGRSEGVHGLGSRGRPRASVLLHGPRLLAVVGSLVGGQAGEGVVALLGEEGVVGVGVDDGARGGAVDELALGEVLPDGGVGREDALGAGRGRHQHGRVQDVGVEGGAVVKGEGGGFPVD